MNEKRLLELDFTIKVLLRNTGRVIRWCMEDPIHMGVDFFILSYPYGLLTLPETPLNLQDVNVHHHFRSFYVYCPPVEKRVSHLILICKNHLYK